MKQTSLPIYVDLQDTNRTVQPCAAAKKGKVECRVFFNDSSGKPQFAGKTMLPVKMFDDGFAPTEQLTRSQRVGFLYQDPK